MELRRSDKEGLERLARIWKDTPGAEFEAMLTGVDMTAWQDVIQYLRSLGMRERSQIIKMNICLSNDIRLTLEGAGAIQAYCRDNRIAGKPFVAMLKEKIDEATPVVLDSYAVKAKLKREVLLEKDDPRVKEVLDKWDFLGKHFRSIQRFEFVAPGGVPIRFDVSIVRENAGRPTQTFQQANIIGQPDRYEIEVELTANRESTTAEAAARSIIRGISWLLQGRQRSYVLVTNQVSEDVRSGIAGLFGLSAYRGSNVGGRGGRNSNVRNRAGPAPTFRFPGPQPATLERKNIIQDIEAGVPNVRLGYNITDKADGLRCLLYVAPNGKIYLVDGGGRVYATGKQVAQTLKGTVLDGEWIRRAKDGKVISTYMAFDIMADRGNSKVAEIPFMGAEISRLAVMTAIVTEISTTASESVAGIPANQKMQISVKTFQTAEGSAIFQAATSVLDMASRAQYNTDGLIFTPNAAQLPIGRGTWSEQLKWKPPHENTIDFLVIVDKERNKDGTITGVDAIGMKYREDSGQTVRYKTLRLFVGSSRDVAFADPRQTILGGNPLPTSLEEGEWREVEFRPSAPRDPMAAVCYVGISEGSADPAAATMAAQALDTDSDVIRCTRTADIIQSNMIVEMAYHPERAPGWRWEPTRVRHDKTERWLAQLATGSRKGGTMNADWVSNSIWTTLHNPVTLSDIQTGMPTECKVTPALEAANGIIIRRSQRRDLVKVQCMKNFHEDFIKRRMLLGRSLPAGATICDLAMGAGDDIAKWITAGVGFAFGCDINGAAINDNRDGAYRVLLDKMVALGGRDRVPPMVFVQADVARTLPTGEAGTTTEDQALLQREFNAVSGGRMAIGADVVSCMFATPYMFRDADTLAGFLNTLADTVKVGGLLVGCGMDGDAVARMMANSDEMTTVGRDGRTDVWSITKRYGTTIGSSVPVSEAGLGKAIDINFIAAGESRSEFLVSWPYFKQRLAEVGLVPLAPEELAALELPASSQMFSETWGVADTAGKRYEMTDAIKQYSFMHRWWVLRRREDRRPAPPRATPAPPLALTQQAPPTEAADALLLLPLPSAEGEVGEQQDVIEMPEESVAAAPAGPYLVGSLGPGGTITDDMRIGPEFPDWHRYLMMGAQSEITDKAGVKYPSIESAMAAFKLDTAPPLDPAKPPPPGRGVKYFRVEGIYHQDFETKRQALRDSGATDWKLFDAITQQESKSIADRSASKEFKKYGLLWDKARWDTMKMDKYREYITQRYEKDERFRRIIQMIVARGGEIMVKNGKEPNELGVGVDAGGAIVGGDNFWGKVMMSLAAA